jgi:hypothetical protein
VAHGDHPPFVRSSVIIVAVEIGAGVSVQRALFAGKSSIVEEEWWCEVIRQLHQAVLGHVDWRGSTM